MKGKKEYTMLLEKVRIIINRYDPEGLEPGNENGAPIDEYDNQVAQIVNYSLHNQEDIKLDRKKLLYEINKIWKDSFEHECSSVEQIADNIATLIF